MILRNTNIFPITALTRKLYLKQIHDHGHKNRIYKGHPNKNRREFRAFCRKRYLPSSVFGRKFRHSAGEWELLWVREGQVQASEILRVKAVGPEMLEKTNSSRKLMWLIPETYLPVSACFWVKIRVKKIRKTENYWSSGPISAEVWFSLLIGCCRDCKSHFHTLLATFFWHMQP